jgi:hypothetical protein
VLISTSYSIISTAISPQLSSGHSSCAGVHNLACEKVRLLSITHNGETLHGRPRRRAGV